MDGFTSKQLIKLGELQCELSLLLHTIKNPGGSAPIFSNTTIREIHQHTTLMREQINELKTGG